MSEWQLILLVLITTLHLNTGSEYNHCCSFPCQNAGICMTQGSGYVCDCTGLQYYGKNCETPKLLQRMKNWIKPDPETVHAFMTGVPWLWKVINSVPFLQKAAMKYIYISRNMMVSTPPLYNSGYEYITMESYFNTSYYARTLPPVPHGCPTPMGIVGRKELPDADILAERMFLRKTFIPEPYGTNVLFAYYAQHFTHQFFKTDFKKGPGFTWGSEGVDLSHIYGKNVATQNALRAFKDGKLKHQILNGEVFPPFLKDTPGVEMNYPPHVPETDKFAMGQPFFALLPGLFVYATIWLREHNRVCDILKQVHSEWDDEQFYQTAKLILVAETIKITIEDYVQHMSQYKVKLTFDPELTHGEVFQYSNRIRIEFNHLYHWHSLFPDKLTVNNVTYHVKDMLFTVQPVFIHGLDTYVDALSRQQAGALTQHNHDDIMLHVVKSTIKYGRTLRMQSLNQYRKKFMMKPFKTFEELTGDKVSAKELEELYGDIDAVEFFPGLMLEKLGPSVTPTTTVNIGGPYAVKGLMSNPVVSPEWWRPSTFGGEVGMKIIKTATLKTLFCENLKSKCSGVHISFKVPETNERSLQDKSDILNIMSDKGRFASEGNMVKTEL